MKILHVEDEEMDSFIANKILTTRIPRIEIDTAQTLKSAVEILVNNKYDGVITDLRLPDTVTAVSVVTTLFKNTTAPVMVYSGSYMLGILDKCLEAGANRYVRKGSIGVSRELPQELLSMIRLDRRRKELRELSIKLGDDLKND